MKEMASRTEGKVLENAKEVFRKFNVIGKERQNMMEWLVLLSMLLFFIDITLRRFGLSFIPSLKKEKVQKDAVEVENTNISQLLKDMRKK